METSFSQPEPDGSNNNQANLNQPDSAEPGVLSAGAPNNSPGSASHQKHNRIWIVLGVIILVVACGLIVLILSHSKNTSIPEAKSSSCISRSFSLGSSGSCVSDIQNMVDFFETDNLSECLFKDAQTLDVNGDFNAATKDQVSVVQTWLNCYNKQEGAPGYINADGTVGSSTWSDFCTYAYDYPKQAGQSSSPYFKASLAAGKNAGC